MNPITVIASLMLLIQSGEALRCYTCLFPTIAPMECIKFPVTCPPSEKCLISTATGKRGNFQFVLKERSCTVSSLCGTSGEKNTLGINVTFHNTCCETDLCNSGTSGKATMIIAVLPLLLLLLA
ncbi:CD59 glycoprotein-like [Spea bombifrons]|uniref:CD59 glycoprotein-like n=1 Tax=Spea bombifrons TaxID=233779 RepID=UPI00234B6A61|nr:CD59 glycoprotein-like [Spea bombifrons]